MEIKNVTLDIKTKEISRELLVEGYTKKVECKNYWDAHGKRIEYAPTMHTFDCEKKFEIYKVITETFYPSLDYTHNAEWWKLYVDGEYFDLGELMGYNVLKTKLKLDVCIGAG